MKLYNSESMKIEQFQPINDKCITMYVCGPTVYSDIHIGNARPIIFFNTLANYFKALKYELKFVSNITDIDDKIINRAIELNISEEELTTQTTKEYMEILKQLNVSYDQMPKVTEYIADIIEYIENLVNLGYAYEVNGDVYFRTNKIEQYGQISKQNIEMQQIGSRVDVNVQKENDTDFVLWKKTTEGITFDSTFSKGRPGWHTECVVMIDKIFNTTIDIHGGGMDLKFPHHENENAQCCAFNKKLANYWVHNGFVNINDEKMSKSIGNTLLVKDILSKYNANVLKMLLLQTNYRSPINITEKFINDTVKITNRLQIIRNKFGEITNDFNLKDKYVIELQGYFENDMNTANVISKLIEWLKDSDFTKYCEAFKFAFYVLNLVEIKNEIPQEIADLIKLRTEFKLNKQFEKADEVRKKINLLGYEIKDTREGVECHKI